MLRWAVCFGIVFSAAGCGEPDEVRRYRVPRVEHRAVALSLPDYQAPKDWKPKDRQRGEFARFKQSYQVGKSEVSVTAFAGSVGSLLQNINRWRDKVGLEPVKELPRDVGKIKVAGADGDYVDIQGSVKRLFAVLFEHDDYMWVIMMLGPSDEVARQKQAFEGFARSVSFQEDKEP